MFTHNPDILLIDYALNDRSIGLEQAKQSWEKMIKKALQRDIKIILLTPSPDQRVDILAPGNQLELHTKQIIQLAMKYHIGIADPFTKFQKISMAGGHIEDFMSHVNHPNEKGHEIIASELMRWFDNRQVGH